MKRILTVAGSDSGGGAGIQADLKTITVLGGYGLSVITALTAQNTIGVQAIHDVPLNFIAAQFDSVLSDIGADAAKTGMLATAEVVRLVAAKFKEYQITNLVVDPVMIAKSGDALLKSDAIGALINDLLPLAVLVTPNLPEARVIVGQPVKTVADMAAAARKIQAMGPGSVLVKGGHLDGPALDLLFDGHEFREYSSLRVTTPNTHGTGCTFSSALTTYLAQGHKLPDAVFLAKDFITEAILRAHPLGHGHGPTNHYALLEKKAALEALSTTPNPRPENT